MSLVKFAQTKLILVFEDEGNKKHHHEVAKIFGHRWFASVGVSSSGGEGEALESFCLELVHLATFMLSAPFDVLETHPLIALLRLLVSTAVDTASDLKQPRPKRRGAASAHTIEISVINKRMKAAAKALVQWIQIQPPKIDPGAGMATVHLLSLVQPDWISSVVDALVGYLAVPAPPAKASENPTDVEAGAVILLQSCRAMRVVIGSGGAGIAVSQETIANAFTLILAKYIGHLQQKIILAAAGGLTAMIEPTAGRVSSRYLVLNYALMNQYYTRILSMIPTLQTSEQNMGYTLRFVFLLSEFLRLYPGWAEPHKELEADAATLGLGTVPNRLAKGEGICENVNAMLHQLVAKLPAHSAQRAMTIIMRAFGSLCILRPAAYFRRNVNHITNSLSPSSDSSVQTQGLLLLKDFLVDEEGRILKSISAQKHQDQQQPAPDSDQNSGMATWLMQQFYKQVLCLAGSTVRSIRVAAFDVLELSVHQGLQPPSTSAEVLIAVCGDPQSELLRPRVVRLLHSIADRHEDVIPTRACSGVIRCFDFVVSSGQNPISCVAQDATDVTPHLSLHDVVYKCLSKLKKNRESFLVGVMRLFYQESKLEEWCAQRIAALGDHRFRTGDLAATLAGTGVEPATLLMHLAMHIALLPFVHVSEVLYVMEQIRVGVDLVGQVTLEALEAMTKVKDVPPFNVHTIVEIARATGFVMLHFVKSFVKKEFGLTAAKARNASATALLPQREPNSKACGELLRRSTELCESLAPVRKWLGTGEADNKLLGLSLAHLSDQLHLALEEHSKDAIFTDNTTPCDARSTRTTTRRRRVVETESTSSESSSSNSDVDDE